MAYILRILYKLSCLLFFFRKSGIAEISFSEFSPVGDPKKVTFYSHFFRIRLEWNTPSCLWGFLGILEPLKKYLVILGSEIATPMQTRHSSSNNLYQFRLIKKLTALFDLRITKFLPIQKHTEGL